MSSSRLFINLGLTTATVGYGLYCEQFAQPYAPTPSSYFTNLTPLLQASLSGMISHRYPELSEYNSPERTLLADGPDHVANVNSVLSERGIDINKLEFILIDSQFRMNIEPGTPLDAAFEQRIAESFEDSYQKNLHTGSILQEVASKQQMESLRIEASNNKLGSNLHGFFNRTKSTARFIVETLATDEDQIAYKAMKYYQEKDKALIHIDQALENANQQADSKQASSDFREQMRILRGDAKTEELHTDSKPSL